MHTQKTKKKKEESRVSHSTVKYAQNTLESFFLRRVRRERMNTHARLQACIFCMFHNVRYGTYMLYVHYYSHVAYTLWVMPVMVSRALRVVCAYHNDVYILILTYMGGRHAVERLLVAFLPLPCISAASSSSSCSLY